MSKPVTGKVYPARAVRLDEQIEKAVAEDTRKGIPFNFIVKAALRLYYGLEKIEKKAS